MENQQPGGFSQSIHGARGLFCLFVYFYHIWNSGLPRPDVPFAIEQTMESMRYGVELFFAISGLVIFSTLAPILNGRKTPMEFIGNRASRIFPVLWVVILFYIPLAIIDREDSIVTQLEPLWLFYLKLCGNLLALGPVWPVPVFYGVTWTIGYEFAFYSLCFTYLCGQFYWKRNLLLPVITIGVALLLYHPRGLFFLSGILVGMNALNSRTCRLLSAWPLLWLTIFLIAWQSMAAPVSPFFSPILEWNIGKEWPIAIIAFTSLTFSIAGIFNGDGPLCNILKTRPMLWLGTISYSLYLWHPILLGIVKFIMKQIGLVSFVGNASQLLLLLLATPLCFYIASLSHSILETTVTIWLRKRLNQSSVNLLTKKR